MLYHHYSQLFGIAIPTFNYIFKFFTQFISIVALIKLLITANYKLLLLLMNNELENDIHTEPSYKAMYDANALLKLKCCV